MALTPRLELRQGQTLALTPQLQQAIKLLRMSNLELAEYVAAEVEKNPLLEIAAPPPAPAAPVARLTTGGGGDGRALDGVAAEATLWEHLREQIGEMRAGADEAEAALLIADELEEDGYLRVPLAEVAVRHRLTASEATRGLKLLQSCDPAGVGARSLAECLALQLRDLGRLDPAIQALLDNLALAAKGRMAELQEICGVDAEDLAEMLAELRALDPKPGLRFAAAPVQVAVPDVYVSRGAGGALAVELNTETLPRVLVNNVYAAQLGSRGREASAFISEMRGNASWLVRSLEQRARTILRVATEIARRQERFFEEGSGQLRPLTQADVAERLDLHVSTVSRVAGGKFLACGQGTFEFRYFFSPAIQAVSGGEAYSAVAVRERIRQVVAAEPGGRALSDDKIAARLRSEGIDVARRTVAKYREAMGIPSSVERRRLKSSHPKIHSVSA